MKIKEVKQDYFKIFSDHILKCFGDNNKGILTFSNANQYDVWDVSRNNKTLTFGVDQFQNIFFNARLLNFFCDQTGVVLRVFTNEKYNKIPIKKLYGFFLHKDFTLESISAKEVYECFSIDNTTGKKIKTEDNVIYSDIDGNNICWFDIE